MTNEDIEAFIDALNAKSMRDRIFLSSLSEYVDAAKVWPDYPEGRSFNESSYDFFFIKNVEGTYVAAVLDMHHDLHVFVKESHRKKGHLSAAMKSVVLPKLYQNGRERQAVSFREQAVGTYCEKHWGFTVTGPTSAELDLTIFKDHPIIHPKGVPLTHEDSTSINMKWRRAKLYVQMLKEQIEAAYGDSDGLFLDELIAELSNLDDALYTFNVHKQLSTKA